LTPRPISSIRKTRARCPESDSLKDFTMNKAIFTAGLRTPFGRAFKGVYAETRPDDLVVELLQASRKRHANLWELPLDDLFVGCAYPEGEQGYNLARMVALGVGLEVPAATVNRLCASSLEAVALAAARIRAGWGDCFLVAGIESMSRIPRRGANFSPSARIGEVCPLAYIPNGDTAENVARNYPGISRAAQEAFAAASHEKADAAWSEGMYAGQVHPYLCKRDEFIRVPVDRAKMASLPPAFGDSGVVTAATSSPLSDGATSGFVISAGVAAQAGIEHGIEILDVATAHVPPEVMGVGPVPSTEKLLRRNNLSVVDIAAWEINEAFAIQVLASLESLGIPESRVNNWGGAIALGHPLGASGLRLLMTLHDRMMCDHDPGCFGIATLCVGGGQGLSMLVRSY
jgi:acetyl-CoA acyltransferase